jgi:hypothetical protein
VSDLPRDKRDLCLGKLAEALAKNAQAASASAGSGSSSASDSASGAAAASAAGSGSTVSDTKYELWVLRGSKVSELSGLLSHHRALILLSAWQNQREYLARVRDALSTINQATQAGTLFAHAESSQEESKRA